MSFFAENRALPDGSTEPRAIQNDNRRYFVENPKARAYVRPMRPGEFGACAPALPDNLPPG